MAAQTTPAVAQAVATITAPEIARHIGVLAADSMHGRATPSPELEQAARYVAAQFQQLGLTYGPRDTSWIWRYPVPGQLPLDYARSHVSLSLDLRRADQSILDERGKEVWQQARLSFTTAAYFAPEVGLPVIAERFVESMFSAQRTGSDHSVLLAGRYTAASVPVDTLRDQVVFYVPTPDADTVTRQQVLTRLYAASAGVIIVSDEDSTHFAAALRRAREQPVRVVESFMRMAAGPRRWPWAVVVRTAAVEGLLGAAGVDLVQLRADSTPVVQPLPRVRVWLDVLGDEKVSRQTAPLVLGVLDGKDSLLKQDYVVFTAHLDAQGEGVRVRPGQPDRIDHGAGESASGIAGLLALARAFSQPGARPRRSLLFLATSGGAPGKDAWSSNAYLELFKGHSPPPGRLAGLLDLDMIGRLTGTKDSIAIDGLDDIELSERPEWVAAAHPELGLAVRDGGTVVRPTSDHFPFVRSGVPSLIIHTGTHAESAETSPVDVAQAARIVKFIFYLAEAMANADQRPRWSAAGRARLAAVQQP